MLYYLATFTIWLLCSIAAVLSQQTTKIPVTSPDNLNGDIQYVGPLNNLAGYSARNDDDAKFDCYRCNRYKGGATGCPETKRQIPGNNVPDNAPYAGTVVRGCEVCLKVKTIAYHRNKDYIFDKMSIQPGSHFERNEVISRTCIEDKKDARLLSGCIVNTAASGSVERCYCQGNLCNAANGVFLSIYISILLPILLCAFPNLYT